MAEGVGFANHSNGWGTLRQPYPSASAASGAGSSEAGLYPVRRGTRRPRRAGRQRGNRRGHLDGHLQRCHQGRGPLHRFIRPVLGKCSATIPDVTRAPDISGYTVSGVCGRGGFGVVYRAWQQAVGREVAVKIDNRVLLTDRDQRRFLREVSRQGRLSGHPNVIDVYDAGTLPDGRPYLVMELCPGGSLQDELNRYGRLAPARVKDIGVALADALAAAHQAGVLHRDIKPANVLINRYGVVGLADFGLASLLDGPRGQSVTREALTPAYAPPEAFRGGEPSPAGDVYSLAATLYALLAGAPPHVTPGEELPTPVMFMMRRDLPAPDIDGAPPSLMAVLRQGLAVGPADRPPLAAAFRDALAACPSAEAGAPTQPGSRTGPRRPRPAPRRPVRRGPWRAWCSGSRWSSPPRSSACSSAGPVTDRGARRAAARASPSAPRGRPRRRPSTVSRPLPRTARRRWWPAATPAARPRRSARTAGGDLRQCDRRPAAVRRPA